VTLSEVRYYLIHEVRCYLIHEVRYYLIHEVLVIGVANTMLGVGRRSWCHPLATSFAVVHAPLSYQCYPKKGGLTPDHLLPNTY
jgi:hypothetical protein